MALVTPLSADHDLETKELAEFFNETLRSEEHTSELQSQIAISYSGL